VREALQSHRLPRREQAPKGLGTFMPRKQGAGIGVWEGGFLCELWHKISVTFLFGLYP
jgi:hypothetical protein